MTTKPLSDIHSCYEFVGRAQLKIDMETFCGLPLHELPPLSRQFLYAVLELNRGKAAHALGFIRQAKESAVKPKELAHALYVEGLLLLLTGEADKAIERYKTCVEMCRVTGDKALHFDALLLLSSIYMTIGEPALARVYEQQAALILPRKRYI
jgi:tetratricopeptide (TPR) repeat protein